MFGWKARLQGYRTEKKKKLEIKKEKLRMFDEIISSSY
jgi:hypothetical protein